MKVNAEGTGMQLTVGNDARITRLGQTLRKRKLDELPQLYNVLAGDMSFVGPRPEVPCFVEKYTEEQRVVLKLRPGITDPASIKYRNESEILAQATDPETAYVTEIVPDKIRINLAYSDAANLWTDIGVILATVFPPIRRPS
jgi:lipopolysaccharide/colanic/teichoic acid biosynthesis glycosyltransferase